MTDRLPPDVSLMAAAISSREAFEAVRASGETAAFTGVADTLWQTLQEYYEKDQSPRADPALLRELTVAKLVSPKKQKAAVEYLETVAGFPVSLANVATYLESASRLRIGNEVAGAIAMRRPQAEIDKLLLEYQGISVRFGERQEEAPADWASILTRRAGREGGLFISPASLNKALGGGLMPGMNLTVFSRPEAGKTAFSINAAVGFARKGVKVLYIGNEDPIEDLALRALCCITGKPAELLLKDPPAAAQEAQSLGLNNLLLREVSPGTLEEVERLVKLHQPAVLVVDQLRNLLGGKSDNYTLHLDKMAQGVRALGKRYNLVTISVTQAGDSAQGKSVLNMGDIDYSNTGIPGAADVLIGIGMTEEMERAGVRNLCIVKNKLTGTHDVLQVRIQPQLSRIRS